MFPLSRMNVEASIKWSEGIKKFLEQIFLNNSNNKTDTKLFQ